MIEGNANPFNAAPPLPQLHRSFAEYGDNEG